jgi:aspartate carbamoyltransferase catalytic subunit
VKGDVTVDSEVLLVTDFVNLKIKSAQSFGGAHRGRVCVRVFIEVSTRTCMSICVCTVFLKKNRFSNFGQLWLYQN